MIRSKTTVIQKELPLFLFRFIFRFINKTFLVIDCYYYKQKHQVILVVSFKYLNVSKLF